jgi:hypothetical protein
MIFLSILSQSTMSSAQSNTWVNSLLCHSTFISFIFVYFMFYVYFLVCCSIHAVDSLLRRCVMHRYNGHFSSPIRSSWNEIISSIYLHQVCNYMSTEIYRKDPQEILTIVFPLMSKGLFTAFVTIIGNVSGLNFSLEPTRLKLILLTIVTVF